jgi:integrase/recombinase XerD
VVRSSSRVDRVVVVGPLVPFVDAYRAELEERGYAQSTQVHELQQVARLSRWLAAGGLAAADLDGERVEQFLAWRRATGVCQRVAWSRSGLVCLLDVLRGLGVLAAEEPERLGSPTDVLLARFERYLFGERGLTAGSVRAYLLHARRFLGDLGSGRELAGLSAFEVTDAVMRKSRSGVSVSAVQLFVCALRAFLRFCFIEGFVEADLSRAALAVSGRGRRSSLPRRISRADAAALLDCCDRRSATGRRDYAVIVTLLRLGLRASEVAGLALDDIDWRAAELVVRGKGGREDRLPLPADVGEAISSYLQRGRPRSSQREVFLRSRAPFRPIASGTVSSTVRRACKRAGVPVVGAHRLRHTAACEMVAAHVPLVQIGQVLRHQSLQSTAIYARVDVDQLRLLAAPWPGGAQR